MLTERITITGGEIAVYQDADGFHAERWSEASQAIVDQSGDRSTAAEAIEAVSVPVE